MSARLQVFLFVIWGFALLFLLNKVRKKQIEIKMVLPWLLLDVLLFVLTAFPSLFIKMSVLLGIETPINMLLFFGLVFFAMLSFYLSVSVSLLNKSIKELTQKIALNEYEIERLSKEADRENEQ